MRYRKRDLIHPKLSYLINGLLFKAHNSLGRFRNEKQYADALEELLKENGIRYQREVPLPKSFKGEKARRNIPDFLIDNKIILDIKAKRLITKEDYYQVRRYLVSYKKKLGIIINFRQRSLAPKRVLNTDLQT
ncbi:MAG: GxxExxY protein [Candidatus Paceibacterales bacterium]